MRLSWRKTKGKNRGKRKPIDKRRDEDQKTLPIKGAPEPPPLDQTKVHKVEGGAPAVDKGQRSGRDTQIFLPPSAYVGVLVAVEGPLAGRAWTLRGDAGTPREEPGAAPFHEVTLGRDESSDVHLPDPFKHVSAHHATLVITRDHGFLIKPSDPRSENRTRRNGQPTDGEALEDGDSIQLGSTTLLFRTLKTRSA